jgi:hypothetical protein
MCYEYKDTMGMDKNEALFCYETLCSSINRYQRFGTYIFNLPGRRFLYPEDGGGRLKTLQQL